ncbi:Aspartyl protease [Hyunsoonleella jejuensis]|uniref:Aspartyl protease n=1 Tax=Hyunsoonleella jejuensis TaxID=419940 RepID=A0A1H9FG19_9FLAO|nr:aspartyl protease family protein [Hyunsoonleella jejuensis]SEQ36839.1 Aspartyl protease [Hyunsoonleella jejuensis]
MNKSLFKFCLFFLCISAGFAQKTKFKTGDTNTKKYFTSITYKNVNDKIIIPVTIKDSTYQFLFDTGAPNVISTSLLSVVKYSSGRALTISDSNDRKQKMNLITLKEITVGDITFSNTSALVFDKSENILFDCFEIDGIIGSNLLQKSIVQINPETKELVLTNSLKNLRLGDEAPTKLFIVNAQGSPYIEIKLKGDVTVTEKLLFDTGASGFYDMSKRRLDLFNKHKVAASVLSNEGVSGMGLFGASETNTKYRLKIPEILINSSLFKNVSTFTTDDDHSRIGSDILKYGVVTLDFKKKRFYFNGFNETNDLKEKLLGFTPVLENNKLIVGVVWDEELKDKISYGDEILGINDIDLTTTNICDMISKKSPFKSSDVLEITFKNKDNQTNTYTIKREFQD